MSGHSKWATIKRRKGANDAKRGKLFAKLIRQIEVAARAGGKDLDANPNLRAMYQKARDNSVPIDTIERAIKRGAGEMEGVVYEQAYYEGYAAGGVAVYVEVLTDNRNRTGSELRTIFNRNGGSLAEPGAVAWQFERKGVVMASQGVKEDEIMEAALEAGAEDLSADGDFWRITCDPGDLPSVRAGLEAADIAFEAADLTMLAQQTVPVEATDNAKSVLRLIDLLEDHDDVNGVFANFDISDEILADALEAMAE